MTSTVSPGRGALSASLLGTSCLCVFGHLEAGFHFVPEGHTIVARRFIAGLAINKVRVPEGRLKLVLGS